MVVKIKPLHKGIIFGIITMVAYLTVVVLTTPALPPDASISAAFELNSIIIIGMGIGVGLQMFLAEKSKILGCRLDVKKKAFGGNSGSTAATSFFHSFHSFHLGVVVGGCMHYHCCQV